MSQFNVGDRVGFKEQPYDQKGGIITELRPDITDAEVVMVETDHPGDPNGEKGLSPYVTEDLYHIYTPEELIYSAEERCECGSGFAYPKKVKEPDINGPSVFVVADRWNCAQLLMGKDRLKDHSAPCFFNETSMKSEESIYPDGVKRSTRP